MTAPIFDINKSIQVILYVANRLERKDFHKIFKIIYFADRNHISEYGRSITGDTYVAMKAGPVPTRIYDIFKVLRGDSLFSDKASMFNNFFDVENDYFIKPKQQANTDYLSESDIEILDASIKEYGSLSIGELCTKSHDYAWSNTDRDKIIDISDIMLENGETTEYIHFVTNQIKLQRVCLS